MVGLLAPDVLEYTNCYKYIQMHINAPKCIRIHMSTFFDIQPIKNTSNAWYIRIHSNTYKYKQKYRNIYRCTWIPTNASYGPTDKTIEGVIATCLFQNWSIPQFELMQVQIEIKHQSKSKLGSNETDIGDDVLPKNSTPNDTTTIPCLIIHY